MGLYIFSIKQFTVHSFLTFATKLAVIDGRKKLLQCVYFGQKSSIPFALVLWRKVDGRGKELVSAYILKIKLKSFTQEKLNSTVAARLKAQGLWQTPILWEVVIFTLCFFLFPWQYMALGFHIKRKSDLTFLWYLPVNQNVKNINKLYNSVSQTIINHY